MLTDKKYNTNDVVTFKLTSGEEIIARITEDRDSSFLLTKPVALLNTPTGGVGMMPSPISINHQESIVLNKHAVAIHGKSDSDVAKQYIEKTTGISLVKSM